MPTIMLEGLDSEDIPMKTDQIVRIGPLNVSSELREIMEAMAEDEGRSISSVARILIERGLRYTEEKGKK